MTNGILGCQLLHVTKHLIIQATETNMFHTVQVKEAFIGIKTVLFAEHVVLVERTHAVYNIRVDLVIDEPVIVEAGGKRIGRSLVL